MDRAGQRKSRLTMTAVVTAVSVVAGLLVWLPSSGWLPDQFSSPAFAARPEKAKVCHRTNAMKNPYRFITVSASAVNGAESGSDHQGHNSSPAGSVWSSSWDKATQGKWEDVFYYKRGGQTSQSPSNYTSNTAAQNIYQGVTVTAAGQKACRGMTVSEYITSETASSDSGGGGQTLAQVVADLDNQVSDEDKAVLKAAGSKTSFTSWYTASGGNFLSEIQTAEAAVPVATTLGVTSLAQTTVTLNGSVDPHSYVEQVSIDFEYSAAADMSNSTAVTATPASITAGTATVTSVTAAISGLSNNTTYYYRVVVYNDTSGFQTTGAINSFKTLATGEVAQQINFTDPADDTTSKVYGADFSVTATSVAASDGTTATGLTTTITSLTTGICTVVGTTVTPVTTGTCTLQATQAGGTSGSATYGAAAPIERTITITQKPLTISSGASAASRQYTSFTDATVTCSSPTLAGVVGSDTVTVDCTSATGTFNDKNVGTGKSVTVTGIALSGAHAARYTLTQPTLTANITAAPLTVTPVDASKVEGASDPSFTYTVSGLLGSDTASVVTGTVTVARASGETSGTYSMSASGGTATNYSLSYGTGTFTISAKTAQVIDFTTPGAGGLTKTYGDAPFTIQAASKDGGANTGLTVTFTPVDATVCTVGASSVSTGISSATVTILKAGSCQVTASQAGNATYAAATDVVRTITVNTKALTITASSHIKTYGAADPTFTSTPTGLVSGDTLNTGSITYTFADGTSYPASTTVPVNAGTYSITPSTAALSSGLITNYTVSYTAGTYTINQALLTIAAADTSKTYGATDPSFAVSTSGLVAGDVLDGTQIQYTFIGSGGTTYASSATPPTQAGSYTITPSNAALSSGQLTNYSISYAGGTYTINKATATVTPVDASKVEGAGDPAFSYTVAGLISGDTTSVVTGTVTVVRTSGETAGTYAMSASGGTAVNYTLSYGTGTFTISAKTAQQIDFGALSTKVYGDPAFTIQATAKRSSDLVNTGLTVTFTPVDATVCTIGASSISTGISSATVTILKAGGCQVTASQAGNATYAPATNVNQAFTISPAPLTIAAGSPTKTYGAADPTFTSTPTGLVSGDTLNTGSITYTFAGTGGTSYGASTTVPVNAGTYSITPSTAALSSGLIANYTVSYTAGTYTINTAAATVNPVDASKVLGSSDPSFTYTVSGLVAGDTSSVVSGVTVARASGETAGTYTMSASGGTAANYTLSYGTGTFTISAKTAQQIDFGALSTKVYGDPAFTIQATAKRSSDLVNTGLTVTFTPVDATVCTIGASSISTGISSATVTILKAGNCQITASQTGNATYAPATNVNQPFTINPATLTITANSFSKVAGAANPTFTSSANGLVGGDALTVSSIVYRFAGNGSTAYTSSTSVPTAAGAYSITPSSAALSTGNIANYVVNYVAGTYTITETTSGPTPSANTPAAPSNSGAGSAPSTPGGNNAGVAPVLPITGRIVANAPGSGSASGINGGGSSSSGSSTPVSPMPTATVPLRTADNKPIIVTKAEADGPGKAKVEPNGELKVVVPIGYSGTMRVNVVGYPSSACAGTPAGCPKDTSQAVISTVEVPVQGPKPEVIPSRRAASLPNTVTPEGNKVTVVGLDDSVVVTWKPNRKSEYYEVTSNGETVCMTVYISCNIPVSDAQRRSYQVESVNKTGDPVATASGSGASKTEGSKMTVVYFDSASAELTPESKRKLRTLLNDMSVLGLRNVYLRGHTDTRGSREYNMQLSADRARNVHNWLEDRTLDAEFTSETPKGETTLAVAEDLKPGDARNRRVEVFAS